jgi:hypothetical protein
MDHRICALLIIICLALEGAGCASQPEKIANRNEVLMPLQTGSTLHRRVILSDESGEVTRSSKKKKKEAKKKESKKEESKRNSPKPTPAPKKPDRQPEQESSPAPDRFR